MREGQGPTVMTQDAGVGAGTVRLPSAGLGRILRVWPPSRVVLAELIQGPPSGKVVPPPPAAPLLQAEGPLSERAHFTGWSLLGHGDDTSGERCQIRDSEEDLTSGPAAAAWITQELLHSRVY